MKTWICHPAYVRGEQRRHYAELPGLAQRIVDYGMPDMPKMWGWGHYHVSERTRFELAEAALSTSLASFPAERIDHVIVGSSEVPGGFMASNDGLRNLLGRHGLTDIALTGVSLTGCNNSLSAWALARTLLLAGQAKNVLVVTAEKARDEGIRFDRHCLFSDAASAVVLSSEQPSGLELLDVECRFGPADGPAGASVFRGDLKKVKAAYAAQLARHQLSESALAAVIAPNYYTPLLQMLFAGAGVPNAKRFAGSAMEHGHCFTCDYLINLSDYLSATPGRDEHLLIFAYADMHYGLGLIRRSATADSSGGAP